MAIVVLTSNEIRKILSLNGEFSLSLDLGKSLRNVRIEKGFLSIGQDRIPLQIFRSCKSIRDSTCYIIHKDKLEAVAFFSDDTKLYYKLVPTGSWPTIKISSTPMHRHIHLSPKEDTELKIKAVGPLCGKVLDTCCGLGYTAIMAARGADGVITFEKDSNVLHIAEFNPYSEELFGGKKIKVVQQDAFSGIRNFPDCTFDFIIHDPPTVAYAPELYSSEFHAELFRALKPGGKLFHYCPTPRKTKGKVYYPKIVRRLKKAGFCRCRWDEGSSGIIAAR